MSKQKLPTQDWPALLVWAVHQAAKRLGMPPEDVGLGLVAWLGSIKGGYAAWFRHFAELSMSRAATGKLDHYDPFARDEKERGHG